jgi:O-antigen/teichoic acid export membrane protein
LQSLNIRTGSLSETSTTISDLSRKEPEASRGVAATISRNIAASLLRVAAISLVALVLPSYLAHHLPVETYAAWILILQLGAYVSYLDLGIQTGISKFVAEYHAKGDDAAAGHHASAGFALMTLAGLLGVSLTFGLAWQVPRLFSTMPANLYHDVRISVMLVGFSLSFGLVCSVYSAVFLGLQRYWIPMTILVINRACFAASVVAVVALHGKIATMGLAVAIVNVVTGSLQVVAWRKKASHILISLRSEDYRVLKKMARYCSLQSIWTLGMLCVTGLDITIVGHYDYVETAYYSIATLPTTFVLLIISSMVNPLMPASSAMSTHRSVMEMGEFLVKITRYATLLLLLTGLPLIVCGYQILSLWVGSEYALHTYKYLRILVLANAIRSICAPYAAMISATGRQGAATATAISEAVVNLSSSLYLASRYGAIGVALGTVIGSLVSVSLHFLITMHFTHETMAISRSRLFRRGMLQPAMAAIPSIVLLPLWWSPAQPLNSQLTVAWGIGTLIFTWFGGLSEKDRKDLMRFARSVSISAPSA